MPIIIMPPHIIMQGMPAFIIAIMRAQHSLNMAMSMPSTGMQVIVMPPPGIISQVILHIIAGIIIGMAMPPMPIGDIIPPIGIGPGIIAPGIIMPGIMAGTGIMPPVIGIGIAVIMIVSVSLPRRTDDMSAGRPRLCPRTA